MEFIRKDREKNGKISINAPSIYYNDPFKFDFGRIFMTFSSKLFCIWSIKFYNIRALFSHILLFNGNQNVHNTAGSFKNSNENANSFWFRKKLCLVIWWSMELFFPKISSFILPHLCMYGTTSRVCSAYVIFFLSC